MISNFGALLPLEEFPPHPTDAQVDWLPTYEYAAKHRNPEENVFECPCEMCGYRAKHRRKI